MADTEGVNQGATDTRTSVDAAKETMAEVVDNLSDQAIDAAFAEIPKISFEEFVQVFDKLSIALETISLLLESVAAVVEEFEDRISILEDLI